MYKAIIIGAGPAGYTCAVRIAQCGHKVALIERNLVGGTCVNWGCTPSKAMISSAKVARQVRHAAEYGIYTSRVVIDFKEIANRRDKIVKKSRLKIKKLLKHWNIELIKGNANLIDHTSVSVNGKIFKAENIVIATGSEPLIPPFLQKEDPSIISSNQLVSIKELPKELTIVGGGIIGLEIATIFSNLGSKVRIIEFMDRCLSAFDSDISHAIMKEMETNGVEILTGHKVIDITDGIVLVEEMKTGKKRQIKSQLNLIAIGRKAVFDQEQLRKLKLDHSPNGITINDKTQTSRKNIYAIGDATGQSILAHVAIQQGIVAAENICGYPRKMKYEVIPAVVYSFPEIATVGNIPSEIRGNYTVTTFPFSSNLRAEIEGHKTGFVKLWIEKKTYRLLAVQLIGEMAGEIIQAYADIIALKTKIHDVIDIIHAHPTYNEIVRNSLEHALGGAIEHY